MSSAALWCALMWAALNQLTFLSFSASYRANRFLVAAGDKTAGSIPESFLQQCHALRPVCHEKQPERNTVTRQVSHRSSPLHCGQRKSGFSSSNGFLHPGSYDNEDMRLVPNMHEQMEALPGPGQPSMHEARCECGSSSL